MVMKVRMMYFDDIKSVADIHRQCFVRQIDSEAWVSCNFKAYPRIMMFIAVDDNNSIVGYSQWLQKSGFRKEVVLELEQIAVLPRFQHQGIGEKLILEPLDMMRKRFLETSRHLKSVMVSTRIDNPAKNIYQSVLGAEIVCSIKELYSNDEVILMTRFDK